MLVLALVFAITMLTLNFAIRSEHKSTAEKVWVGIYYFMCAVLGLTTSVVLFG